ncbi:MAG TPA: ATP-binding protein [Acidimicrobiales bacterium]|nr:ATP-binding protein [Acidimicrobiales bacterium]
MRMTLELDLPRDSLTIPLARHLARNTMREIGVDDDCVGDVEVALTEACTNVLDHSGPGDAYQVEFVIDGHACSIRIVDVGDGFDSTEAGTVPAAAGAESGRGIALMRALVDQVEFESGRQAGTVVLLHKNLVYAEGSPANKLITD